MTTGALPKGSAPHFCGRVVLGVELDSLAKSNNSYVLARARPSYYAAVVSTMGDRRYDS
jgi:hypothetical protein